MTGSPSLPKSIRCGLWSDTSPSFGRSRGETERIFDPRVTRTDNGDVLVEIFARIIELVLDHRVIGAGAAQHVGIALCPDRQDDGLGLDRFERQFRLGRQSQAK